MGLPFEGDKARLVVAIDIGATYSAVAVALLEPSRLRSHHWPSCAHDWRHFRENSTNL